MDNFLLSSLGSEAIKYLNEFGITGLSVQEVTDPNVWELDNGVYSVSAGLVSIDSSGVGFYVEAGSLLFVTKNGDNTKFLLQISNYQLPYEFVTGYTDGSNIDWWGVESEKNKTTEITEESTDEQYPTAKATYALFSGIKIPENHEIISNKVTEITEESTDEQYPSAKAVYDSICDLREYIDLLDTSEILDSGKCGENLTWTLRSSGLLRISGTGRAYDYCKGILIGRTREEIEADVASGKYPEYYAFQEGKTYDDEHGQYVAPWYKYRSEIDFITETNPNGYTTEAAYNKENPNGWKYNRIIIDHGITYIGDWMFYRACGATKLVVPEGVTRIGRWGIRYTPTLKSVVLPNSLTEIEYRGLSRHENLENITFGRNLTTIGDYGLAQNSIVETIELPETVTSIGINQFEGTSAIVTAKLGHITSIPSRTFVSATKLKNVVIPEEVTSIGEYAFYKCASLESINIPSNVATIDANAFLRCDSLHDVYIDSQAVADLIENINSCGYLIAYAKRIYIKEGVTCDFLDNNWAYSEIVDGYKKYVPKGSVEPEEPEEPELPDEPDLPENVVATGSCGTNVAYTVAKTDVENEYSLSIEGDGALNSYQYTALPWYEYKDNIVSLSIDSGVTNLPTINCFREYSKLKTAVVSCETIPNQMFYNCNALESVDLTGVKTIGEYAFFKTGLTEIVIPNGVTTIGKSAFSVVSTASSVTIGKDVVSIGDNAFQNHAGNLIIPEENAIQNIGAEVFIGSIFEGVLNLPAIVTIGNKAFVNNKTFTAINIGSSIESIGAQAFEYNATATVTINKAEADVVIGENAFRKTPADKLIFIS